MAYVNSYPAQSYNRVNGEWIPDKIYKPKTKYSIFWSNGEPWMEALIYLSERRTKSATIRSNAFDLRAYAEWLEENSIHWLHFPIKREERCLERFRGYLIASSRRNSGVPSRRINAVVNFYRWLKARGLIDKQLKMWEEQQVTVLFFNSIGFQRTLNVSTTDLRIRHRKANINSLEGGLLPLSVEDRDTLLNYLKANTRDQYTILHALFVLGFFTGARISSIRTIRIENLKNATPDATDPEVMLVAAGPGSGIKTKFDVQGYLYFLKPVYDFILDYAQTNITRLERQAKAIKTNKSLLFLTKEGKPYSEGSINTAISELRKALVRDGLTQFHDLKFHQSRATCGTELAREFMKHDDSYAIEHVRDWLMHKNESTTWTYIKFLKKSKAAKKANDAFIRQFLGPNFS
ncbi:tyrosine-type recombinase/integrase [Methylophaga nitratireducenticrescens]|uniref:tyrosine-type recombinase/integrase n=1 Tax=Methylophaga nitratireducenticrescens TaxID=754476 RepID=UPI00146D5C22|nr:site-specific integrase [Methylophaga nitratireducenticrescens]